MVAPIFVGDLCLVLVFNTLLSVLSIFCNHLGEKAGADCFSLIVFLTSCGDCKCSCGSSSRCHGLFRVFDCVIS